MRESVTQIRLKRLTSYSTHTLFYPTHSLNKHKSHPIWSKSAISKCPLVDLGRPHAMWHYNCHTRPNVIGVSWSVNKHKQTILSTQMQCSSLLQNRQPADDSTNCKRTEQTNTLGTDCIIITLRSTATVPFKDHWSPFPLGSYNTLRCPLLHGNVCLRSECPLLWVAGSDMALR